MATSDADFIIVGAGPSGCMLAATLAQSMSRPKVLLLEGGLSDGQDDLSHIPEQRFYHWMSERAKSSILDYETETQTHLNGRKIPYTRASGIGGTSAINFSMWTIPPKDWHEEIARLTGNKAWKWLAAKQRYDRIEHIDRSMDIPDNLSTYLEISPDHGHQGPVQCGFPAVYEESLLPELELWKRHGIDLNRDANTGNPVGLSVCWNSIKNGRRSTAADILDHVPDNLEVRLGVKVIRILRNDAMTATGVLLANGQVLRSAKEVILCAGALDTPKILLHSGIGPLDQLAQYGLPLSLESPHIGQHLQDHYHCPFVLGRDEEGSKSQRSAFYRSKDTREKALQQWQGDRTGPLSELGGVIGLVMKKMNGVGISQEKKALSADTQHYLQQPSIPDVEFLLNGPNFGLYQFPDKVLPSQAYVIMLTNPQSRGSVSLQSADPDLPLKFDPEFLSHSYDREIILESTRELMNTLEDKEYSKHTRSKIWWPTSQEEENILSYWREKAKSTWHMSGTVRMGQDSKSSCVDPNFKVWNVKRLRVADLSVLPLLPPTHPQTVAYLIGMMAADLLINEHGLNKV